MNTLTEISAYGTLFSQISSPNDPIESISPSSAIVNDAGSAISVPPGIPSVLIYGMLMAFAMSIVRRF